METIAKAVAVILVPALFLGLFIRAVRSTRRGGADVGGTGEKVQVTP